MKVLISVEDVVGSPDDVMLTFMTEDEDHFFTWLTYDNRVFSGKPLLTSSK